MPYHKRPPRGYKSAEWPLPHAMQLFTGLEADDETKNSAIFPIIKATEGAIGTENTNVNPSHGSFAEDGSPICSMDSIVPRINLRLSAIMSKGAIETDKMRTIRFDWFPIYTSFLPSLEAEDDKTATQIEDVIEMTHQTTDKEAYPLHSGVKLTDGGAYPLGALQHSEVYGDVGLTTNLVMESVAFDKKAFWENMRWKTNKGMLAKVVGKYRTVIITRDRPYTYTSNNFTNPIVKRMNPYTSCSILIHCQVAGKADQTFKEADTTAIKHLDVQMEVNYDEWNQAYDQTPR